MQEFQPMKLICSIATIIERSKGIVLPHIFAVLGVVRGANTKAKIWVRMWLPYKFSTVVRRAREARSDTSKIENNKTHTKHSKQQSNFSSRHSSFTRCYIATSDAIHRVRIPYCKFHLQKRVAILTTHICSSFKIGRTYDSPDSSPSQNARMTPEDHWYACVRGRLEILWRHKPANEENTRSLFSYFLRWIFLKVCILHDIDTYFTI